MVGTGPEPLGSPCRVGAALASPRLSVTGALMPVWGWQLPARSGGGSCAEEDEDDDDGDSWEGKPESTKHKGHSWGSPWGGGWP